VPFQVLQAVMSSLNQLLKRAAKGD